MPFFRAQLHRHFKPLSLGILAACSLWLAGCGAETEAEVEDKDNIVPEVRPEMIFDLADNQPLVLRIETQGLVMPTRELLIQMRVGGYLAEHVVRDGGTVKAGDVLMRLQEEEFALSEAEAQANLDKAMRDYGVERRSRESVGTNRDEAQDRLLKNQYGVTNAEIALERAQLNRSYAILRAPFDGEIQTEEILTPGMNIVAGKEYGLLLDQNRVSVRLEVLAVEINRIRVGMNADVTAPSGEVLSCKVASVSPVINDETKTGQVTAECDNARRLLKRGMNVNARILVQSISGAVRVPRSAVLDRDQRKVVFKLNGGRVEWVYVLPVAMNAEWAVVNMENESHTVAPGDTVAVDRHFTASHDLRVTPKMRFSLPQQSSERQ